MPRVSEASRLWIRRLNGLVVRFFDEIVETLRDRVYASETLRDRVYASETLRDRVYASETLRDRVSTIRVSKNLFKIFYMC